MKRNPLIIAIGVLLILIVGLLLFEDRDMA